jgi:Kef-type K+ transport system membrane component KefB
LAFLRARALALPELAKFAIGLAIIVFAPMVARKVRLPAVVILLLCGVAIGPYGLDVIGQSRPVFDFLADLGKLLLMFFAGLEIDLTRFRQARRRVLIFGLWTTCTPLVLGTIVGFLAGYGALAAVVLGSLLASHTLLGLSIVTDAGASGLEPIAVTVGATVISDTLSLVVFAVCLSSFVSGMSVAPLAIQLLEIAIFIPFILFGLSRIGAYVLSRVQSDEASYFVVMFAILVIAGVLAQTINLPGIVGAFLAGLAVNAAVQDAPVKSKFELLGKSLLIPLFFIGTGFRIDPSAFAQSIVDHYGLICGVVGALLFGKWIAAEVAGRAFAYSKATRWTMWSLTLPQVAATLAATIVAFDTVNGAGQRLIDVHLVNVVLVLMLTTSIIGPFFTQRMLPLMLGEEPIAIRQVRATAVVEKTTQHNPKGS